MRLAFYGVCFGLRGYPFALFVLLVPRSIAFLAMALVQSLMLFSTIWPGGTGYTLAPC